RGERAERNEPHEERSVSYGEQPRRALRDERLQAGEGRRGVRRPQHPGHRLHARRQVHRRAELRGTGARALSRDAEGPRGYGTSHPGRRLSGGIEDGDSVTASFLAQLKYDEQSIKVLKGLEPVRARPGMYTRTDSPLHIVQEMIDNAADEALAGFARRVSVVMHKDGSVSVEDDGRGIPVGPHPVEKAPTVEIVFTRLHAGGKFDKKGGGAYAFSGGLHGVGVSVTNALSKKLEVRVTRDGAVHEIVFEGGEVAQKLKKVGKAPPKESGTVVRAWPDPKYFDTGKVARRDLEMLLRAKAVLLPGLKV